MLRAKQLTVAMLAVAAGIGLQACASQAPTLRPCGVITDSLIGVEATTKDGERRLSNHFERGVAARCWKR